MPEGFPLVLADPGLLERVLANLFSNALRYSPATRPPELQARLVDGMVRLEVVDHGPGVPDSQKERIFEPFKRLHGRHYAGNGLGLAFCQRAIESLGGRIWVESRPGEGSSFCFTLPAAD